MLRLCHFCIMAGKKGRTARKVVDLSEWWRGQKEIKLLGQFADSSAWVDFTQGMDCLEDGPQWLGEPSQELFESLVRRIVIVSADTLKFTLLNGLELTERIGKAVR